MEKLITREKFIGAFIKTFMLTTRKKVSELAKEHECFHLVVVKLVQGYTLTKADREDTASIALDLELFKEIFEESKKVFTDIEVLHTKIPLFV